MEVHAPLGFWAKFPVPLAWKTIVVLCAIGGTGYAVYAHDLKTQENQREVMLALEELVYVLTLDEKERKDLQLRMPDRMRERLLLQERLRKRIGYER